VNVCPLAADSLGVRSVATYVECGDTRVLIDPGATLAADRFGLPPAEKEWEALKRANDRIAAYAARATLVFVSHYHEDHFRYDPDLYAGRTVWAKDPRRTVGPRQAGRAGRLAEAVAGRCRLLAAEGRRAESLDCVLQASPPLPHGVDGTDLGAVVALTVEDRRSGARFVHASDVQGPLSAVAAAYLIRQRPSLLYLSGPPAYLEARVGRALIERGIDNLRRVVEAAGCRVIMDHHAVRDEGYAERFRALWETGRVTTAAGFLGLAEQPLEARRRALWAGQRKAPAPVRPRLNARGGSGNMARGPEPRAAKGGTRP
jgi:hypothetical protein